MRESYSEKSVEPTHNINKKGLINVLCSIFVTEYRQSLYHFEDESDTL